jgi:hypothetical protein
MREKGITGCRIGKMREKGGERNNRMRRIRQDKQDRNKIKKKK